LTDDYLPIKSAPAVEIEPGVIEAIAGHARSALPHECCGVLLGTAATVVEAIPGSNLADDPTRQFLLDPETHFNARRRARESGLAVVGFYHSHPDSPPLPSESDLEGATYADHWYLIVRPLPQGCEARLFALGGSGFSEVKLSLSSR